VRFDAQFDSLAAECRKLGLAHAKPAPSNRAEFELGSGTKESWFASDEAKRLVDTVISYQTPAGGWSKAVDYSAGPRQPGTHWTSQAGDPWHYCGTLDNRSTTEQIKFLAGVHTATGRADAAAAAVRGIQWLCDAQFPNGGWPQNYPVESGYHEAITLNDDAMLHAMEVVRAIAQKKPPFVFVDDPLRERARRSFDAAIACLAAAHVKVDGKPTVWGAQHDPLTLAPVAARKKEPPSLSGSESAALLKFLMRDGPTDPLVTAMVEAGLHWLEAHRITGLRKTKNAAGKTDYIADPASSEIYWARFYDVQTGRPLFAGADDGVVYPTFGEMAAKNKVAYDYFTTKPADVIAKEVARWRKRLAKPE
jgi:PelA/Pel-15E family pectate lyase